MKKIIWFFKKTFLPEKSDENLLLSAIMWVFLFSQFGEEEKTFKITIVIIMLLALIVAQTLKAYGLVRFATIAVLIWLAYSRNCLEPISIAMAFGIPIFFGLWLVIKGEIKYED